MKRILSVLLLFALLYIQMPAAEAKDTNERIIVIFKTGTGKVANVDSQGMVKGVIAQANGEISHEYKNISALAITIPASARRGLENNPNVAAVETDFEGTVYGQISDWGITRTDAPGAWSAGFTGKGVKIAVLDTGIATHEDLIIQGGVSCVSYTSSYRDDYGHGTHVAGIIGARNNSYGTVGIAPEARLYAVKVARYDGSCSVSDVIAGIDWAITNRMNIINISLGFTEYSSALKQAVDRAHSQGILVVAAAGNSGNTEPHYPAYFDSTIAVSATNIHDQIAYFSSYGSAVDIAAPGVQIISTYPNNKYAYADGTSMAAPYVAGNLALLKNEYPTLSAASLRVKLQETALDFGAVGKDIYFGYGLIQAPKKLYDVIFDSQGGSHVPSMRVVYCTLFTPPTPPTKADYIFDGWYKESTCKNAWNFSTDAVTSHTTLYAKWIPNTRILRYGMSGDDVRYVQNSLKTLGYLSATPDGVYGRMTEAAVKVFQAFNGLELPDGMVGNWTLNKISGALTSGTRIANLRYGSSGTAVKAMQTRLKALGYFSATPNGIFDWATEAAVSVFQAQHGIITPDGIAGSWTLQTLYHTSTGAVQTLRIGLRGDAVRAMQTRLKSLGYLGVTPDGMFGNMSKAAVSAFQIKCGLSAPDGIAGAWTLSKLYANNAPANGFYASDISYLQSSHDYENNIDTTWTFTSSGARSLTITFSGDTYTEAIYDHIYIMDGNNNIIGDYTGNSLAGKSVTVLGDIVNIRLFTDWGVTYYGFRVSSIWVQK